MFPQLFQYFLKLLLHFVIILKHVFSGVIEFIEHTKSELYVLLFDDVILLTKHRRAGPHGKSVKVRYYNGFLNFRIIHVSAEHFDID